MYGKGRAGTIYDAKVLKIEYDVVRSATYKYFVHYCGWSNRYDEWIYKDRIFQVVKDPVPRGGRRVGKLKNKGEPVSAVVGDGWPAVASAGGAVDRKFDVNFVLFWFLIMLFFRIKRRSLFYQCTTNWK